MYIPNFRFLAQLGRKLCKEKAQKTPKMRKKDQKPTFWGLLGGVMERKSRNPQTAYLGLLMNVHNKIQLSSSIWRGDREGTALFQDQKRDNPLYLPS